VAWLVAVPSNPNPNPHPLTLALPP
jgi:hypothetical protein